MYVRLVACLLAVLTSANGYAVALPNSVTSVCTTDPRIYHESYINAPGERDRSQLAEAAKRALGISQSNPNFTTSTFNGQWFFEYENEDAIFAGYKVRAHYLSTAIVFTDEGVMTVICNSTNLDQKDRSIHRKAPLWKETLNSNLRVEFGKMISEATGSQRSERSLRQLLSDEVITQAEYDELLARVKSE